MSSTRVCQYSWSNTCMLSVPMAGSPAHWWVPIPRSSLRIDHVYTCNQFAPTYVHVSHYLLDLCSFICWLIYQLWMFIMRFSRSSLSGYYPNAFDSLNPFNNAGCGTDRWVYWSMPTLFAWLVLICIVTRTVFICVKRCEMYPGCAPLRIDEYFPRARL